MLELDLAGPEGIEHARIGFRAYVAVQLYKDSYGGFDW